MRLDNNPFSVQSMHDAIERELAARGIRYAPSGTASLLVHHHAAVNTGVDVVALDQGQNQAPGSPESRYGPGTQVIEYPEGACLVDVSDAKTGRLP